MIAAYSARARPGLTVSVPLAWDELRGLTGSGAWHVNNLFQRLDSKKDAWTDYREASQFINARMKQAPGLKKK